MDRKATINWILADVDLIFEHLKSFEDEHSALINQASSAFGIAFEYEDRPDFESPFASVKDSLSNFKSLVEGFAEETPSHYALNTLLAFQSIEGQVDAAASRLNLIAMHLPQPKTAVRNSVQLLANAWSGFAGRIKAIVQGISGKLWNLLSNYLNLKEWSISGKISTPTLTQIFGISASAELQLTFEK